MTTSLAYILNGALDLAIVLALGRAMLAIYRFLAQPSPPRLVPQASETRLPQP
jgi:hypothetical protein